METHYKTTIISFGPVPLWIHFVKTSTGVLEAVFKKKLYFNFIIMYFGYLNLDYTKQDKNLLRVLLVGSKKALTRKCLKKDKPTINEWMYSIYLMESITFKLRHHVDIFGEN